MKFGIAFANTGPLGTAAGIDALGPAAENAGFESIWTVEHVVVPEGYESTYPYDQSGRMPGGEDSPIPDPLIWLTYLAARTSTVKLGTGILILPQRNPLVVAKELATLDQLSGGRLLLGVGAGWLEEEFDALDVPFDGRGQRLDDYIGALRAAWGEAPASYESGTVSFKPLYSRPAPAQDNVPIVIGGHSKPAARRAGRLGDEFFPGKGSLESITELVEVMRAAAEEAGRDPDAIEVTAGGTPLFADDPAAEVAKWEAIGVTRMVIPPLSYSLEKLDGALGEFGENVIRKFA
jgi:probable F420-dependent oxidoreductase